MLDAVTSGGGLSVSDWPLSDGAMVDGMLMIVMAVWLAANDRCRWLKLLGGIALFSAIVQGVVERLTVIYLLPPAVSVRYACLAQLYFSTTVAMAVLTSRDWLAGARDHCTPQGAGDHLAHRWFEYRKWRGTLVCRAHSVTLRKSPCVATIGFGDAWNYVCPGVPGECRPYELPIMNLFTVLHVATGALTMGASAVACIQVYRNAHQPGQRFARNGATLVQSENA
jgi:hypothetical protein